MANNKTGEMKVTVSMVSESETYKGRVNFEIEEELTQLDEYGNEKQVSQFSLQEYAMRQQLTKACKEYRKALLRADGHLSAGQVGMVLMGATLTINRRLAKAGEPRKFGEGIYERDTYTTEIVGVEINEADIMLDDLAASIREDKAMARCAVANPFGF